MRHGIYCAVMVALALPIGVVQAEGTESTEADAMNLLKALTGQESEPPEILSIASSSVLSVSSIDVPQPTNKKSSAVHPSNVLAKALKKSDAHHIQQINGLQKTIARLQEKIREQEDSLQKLRDRPLHQQQQVPDTSDNASLKQIWLKLRQQLLAHIDSPDNAPSVKSNQQSKQELTALQEKLAAQVEENSEKENKISQLEGRLANSSQEQDKQLEQSQQAVSALQQQLASQNQDNQQKTEQIKQLQEKLALNSKDFAQQSEQLKQLQQLQQEHTKLQEQLTVKNQNDKQGSSQLVALQQAQQVSQQENAKLQAQLAAQNEDSQQKIKQLQQLQEEYAKLQERLTVKNQSDEQGSSQLVALQQAQQVSQQENAKLQAQLTAQSKENEQQAESLKQLQQKLADTQKQKPSSVVTSAELKSEQGKRDYAIGTSFGHDILSLLNSRKSQGLDVNRQLVLAGIVDMVNEQTKLTKEQIITALQASEVELDKNNQKIKTQTEQQGNQFIAKFKKQPNVVKSERGFYYRINYAGDRPIKDEDTVAVVVKESLANGKVIKDMEQAGTSISQPLNTYPPLFREAISKLKNRGTMTMVVPPALAYGDKGVAPDIPPSATMVYDIRVLDVIPAAGKK